MYSRFVLTKRDGFYSAAPVSRDWNMPDMLLKANALFVAPIGAAGYQAGDEIEAELLCGLEQLL